MRQSFIRFLLKLDFMSIEAVFEALPRLYRIEFQSGITDEFLSLGMLRQYRLLSGMTMLVDENTSLEIVFDHQRIIHKGQLCIIFTPTLKIHSWEFCVRQHEKCILYKMVETKMISRIAVQRHGGVPALRQNGSRHAIPTIGTSNPATGTICCASCYSSLELLPLNVYGYANQFVQSLDVFVLMDFSQKYNMGAIESLNTYHVQIATAKLQIPKIHKVEQSRCLSADPNDNLVAPEFLNRCSPNLTSLNNHPRIADKSPLLPHQQQSQLLQNCDLPK